MRVCKSRRDLATISSPLRRRRKGIKESHVGYASTEFNPRGLTTKRIGYYLSAEKSVTPSSTRDARGPLGSLETSREYSSAFRSYILDSKRSGRCDSSPATSDRLFRAMREGRKRALANVVGEHYFREIAPTFGEGADRIGETLTLPVVHTITISERKIVG
ncbi:hypothetical protein KM043_000841 [Ampulex compressa]|nr:hypothetical protein KM043_000841 [Ampulex compressa]